MQSDDDDPATFSIFTQSIAAIISDQAQRPTRIIQILHLELVVGKNPIFIVFQRVASQTKQENTRTVYSRMVVF